MTQALPPIDSASSLSSRFEPIVPVYSQGKHADGRPFYAMRWIDGKGTETLAQAIDRLRFANRTELLKRLRSVCKTVAYAHANGVIHRDLKPANILLGPFGETFVIDWGLARTESTPLRFDALCIWALHLSAWNHPCSAKESYLGT